ncbi:MAG: transposase [Cyanophyceae cyanobacterium]
MQSQLRPEYRRRIEIMLLADRGLTQAQICDQLGCSQDTARHWMMMAQTGQAHHWQESPIGRPKTVNKQYLARLKELVSHSPRDYDYPFQNWTAQWLSKHLAKEFQVQISDRHINRLLKQMGLSTKPQPAENPESGPPQHSQIIIRNLSSSSSPQLPDFELLPTPKF